MIGKIIVGIAVNTTVIVGSVILSRKIIEWYDNKYKNYTYYRY